MAFDQLASLACSSGQQLKCDRCKMYLLCKYLERSNALTPTECQREGNLSQLQLLFETLGLLIVAPDGHIEFATQQGADLLSRYSPDQGLKILPESIQHWFRDQMSQHDGNSSLSNLPLSIEKKDQRLVVRLIPDVDRGRYCVLLEEQALPTFTADTLELLGLTRREAEVLFWIAKDKSNTGIAKVLGCCEGTVRKHIENLYKKLDVQTRMGAVMAALEKLGLLKNQSVTRSQ
jgi:DNA-binding CsgD family transcriptional regulator